MVWDCVIPSHKLHPQTIIYFLILLLNNEYASNLLLDLHVTPITEEHLSRATESHSGFHSSRPPCLGFAGVCSAVV